MSLLDRLRPQWQHSDPEVRLAAVRQLGHEDQDLLHSLARQDGDPRVRRLAVKKLGDPVWLQEIAENESNEALKVLAKSRSAEIWVERASSTEALDVCHTALSQLVSPRDIVRVAIGAHHTRVRRAALARLSEEKALAEVVSKASDTSLRKEALIRLTDSSILQRIASNGTETEIALAALDKIDDADALHAIAEERNAHKIVRQRARARLEKVIPEDHPLRARARQERQEELCHAAEALVTTVLGQTADESLEETTARLGRIQEEWTALAAKTAPEEEVRDRFEKASQAILDGAARQARRQAEKARLAGERQQILARRVELCERLESLEAESASESFEQARSDWKYLNPLPPPFDRENTEAEDHESLALERRFARAVDRCEQRIRDWQAEQAMRSTLEELWSEAEKTATSKLADALRDWPNLEKRWAKMEASLESVHSEEWVQAARTRFTKARERLVARQQERTEKQQQSREDNLARLKQLCGRLEELTQSKELSLKAADRALRLAAESLKRLGPLPPTENRKDWKARLSSARQLLFQRFQDQRETEEWKRWANVDLQEKLIRQAEALREVEDLATVAKELRRIQNEWKRVGAVPKRKSESLWKRFSKVRDELRARCDVYFVDNLKKKEALCTKVESLADSNEWNKTAEAIKRLQAEWKPIGPVPLKQSKVIWRRFRKPCDEFFKKRNEYLDQLKKERIENAKKKAELCRQAEALADSTDWERTANELKRLQAAWRTIGPAPHKKSETLWNRFRKACDHFFDRRNHRSELEVEEKLKQKEGICVELESIVASLKGSAPPPDGVNQKVQEAWSRWAGVGPVPTDEEKPLQDRLQNACAEIVAVLPEALRGTPLDPRANHKRREKLCSRLEELADLYAQDHRDDAVEDVAQKLKRALAANTIGGSSTAPKKKNWKAALQEADRLKANWDRLGPVIDPADQALVARFQSAYANLARGRPTREANRNPSARA